MAKTYFWGLLNLRDTNISFFLSRANYVCDMASFGECVSVDWT